MFQTYLTQTATQIDRELQVYLKQWQRDGEQRAFVEQCNGGKRMRGALVALGYRLAGGEDNPAILQPGIAFEIFQTAILAHDDIIDKSLLRRGKPSLYQSLGGKDYGIAQTICLGDLGFFICIELLATSKFSYSTKTKAIALFAQQIEQTIQGEILDIRLPTQKRVTEAEIVAIALLKTASYSVTGPLAVGATFAGANKKLLRHIQEFGDNLGIAYQIHDDILGIFADEKTIGKSTISDISEGKATLLIWYARQHATMSQKQMLRKLYGKKKVTYEEASTIKQIFMQSGAYTYAIQKRNDYTSSAKESIKFLSNNTEMRAMLEELTSYLLARKK